MTAVYDGVAETTREIAHMYFVGQTTEADEAVRAACLRWPDLTLSIVHSIDRQHDQLRKDQFDEDLRTLGVQPRI